jgi:branched-chain amino acid transport system permease protein
VTLSLPVAAASWELFQQLLVGGIVLGSVYALLGVSVGIIYSTTGIFHFAHAVVYTTTAYLAVVGARDLGLPWVGAVLLGLVAAVLLGLAIEYVTYRPMRAAGATALGVFLASLGLSIAGPNLIQIIFGTETQTLTTLNAHTYNVASARFTNFDVVTVVVGWVLIVGTLVWLRRTRYGLATTAVRTNRNLAATVGISSDRVHLMVFALGSLMVGVAAALAMLDGSATPNMGLTPALVGFIAVFLGGVGSMGGAAVGGLVLGLLTSLSGLWLTGDYRPAVVFGALFLLLIVRPQGLFGRAAT